MRLTPAEREQQWQEYFTKTGRYADSDTSQSEIERPINLRPETLAKLTPINLQELEQKLARQFIIRFAAVIAILWLLSRLLS